MPFDLQLTDRFKSNFQQLREETKKPARKAILLLANDPKHPSLQMHKITGFKGSYGGNIFEAYITMKYRMTWEYGPTQNEIALRNIDNHDECLREP